MVLTLTNVTHTKLTTFLSLSNQHITLSRHQDMRLATAGDLHYEGVLKSHNARCWATLPQQGNFYNHYRANIN